MAKDEKDKESKKAKKKGRKKGKGEGKGEQLLCGCGAVCDAACSASSQRAGRRSTSSSPTREPSPVRGPLSPAPDAGPQRDSTTAEGYSGGDSGDAPARSKPSPNKSCPRSPARSTLGAELMSPRRPPAKAAAPQPSPGAADAAGWETIQAGGKGRRNSVGGPRKAVPVPEPRGSSPEAPRRHSLGSCSRPVAQPSTPSGVSRQQAGPVRAVPVTASPHLQAAAARASPAAPVPDQWAGVEAPSVRALPVTPKAAPLKPASGLSSGDPIIAQHPVSHTASLPLLLHGGDPHVMSCIKSIEGNSCRGMSSLPPDGTSNLNHVPVPSRLQGTATHGNPLIIPQGSCLGERCITCMPPAHRGRSQ